MKKYLLLIAAASLMSSCFDLNQFPHDKLSTGTFWQTEAQAHQALVSIYAMMRDDNTFGGYYNNDALGEIAADYNNWLYQAFIKGTYTYEAGTIKSKWEDTYEGIARANVLLQNVDNVNMSDEQKAIYKGEARFMRAMYYFHLLDFFGGVPLYDETTIVSNEFMDMKKPRSTADETRCFVLDDLDAAIAVLPIHWEGGEYGRATRGAAVALRGKVKLFNKDYTGAATDFEEIVKDPQARGYGYSLYPNYAALFTQEADVSKEMIFTIQSINGVGQEYGLPYALRLGSRSTYGSCWNNSVPTDILADMYENKDGSKFNWDLYFPGFSANKNIQEQTFLATLTDGIVSKYPEQLDLIKQIYENRDPRMMQTLITPYSSYYGCNGTIPKMMEFVLAKGTHESKGYIRNNLGNFDYLWRKFVPEGNMDGALVTREHSPVDFPLIRYADVLLMLAECYNEMGGKSDDAVALINQIRQRPSTNMPALNSGAPWLEARTKAEIFERIVQERAIELACEGHRFSDLKRWGLCEAKLNFVYDDILGKDRYTRIFVERDYLWPIPKNEFERNSQLGENNPGW